MIIISLFPTKLALIEEKIKDTAPLDKTKMATPCSKCLNFLDPDKQQPPDQKIEESYCCPVCLGLWNQPYFQKRLRKTILRACEPYGAGITKNVDNNRFSRHKDPPVISLPGDVIFRYYMASKQPVYKKNCGCKALHVFVNQLKNYVHEQLQQCLDEIEKEQQQQQQEQQQQQQLNNKNQQMINYPEFVRKEEQGYLAVHVVLTTPTSIPRPFLGNLFSNPNTKKSRRKQYETQGGHPRSNLERKLHLQEDVATPLWTVNQAMEVAEKDSKKPFRDDWFLQTSTDDSDNTVTIKPISTGAAKDEAIQIHTALWRRPFLVKGNYTKTRRDVSQTPFFIDADNPKKRQRLGFTSVEELILPPLVELSGGISSLNNSPDGDNVVYGKAKFHASGREDMDVRMILPRQLGGQQQQQQQQQQQHEQNDNSADNKQDQNISGRPFCCEIIDAFRMPTVQDLEAMVHTINHNTGSTTATTSTEPLPSLLPESSQYYGRSPLGVGVDPKTASFARAEVFKNLQSETEEKHKFYGCLCWSETTLPPIDELRRRLTETKSGTSLFPLELKQRTPIRVLHRRANTVRIRHILSCYCVERLDDHYFRLHISTDAGTYVKEYCHGDLGRTQPNVGTLLGCGKTDILELDCEGIQIN